MEEQNPNDKPQSRREFFKNAAKKALPIFGAIAMSQLPFRLNASDSDTNDPWGCRNFCSGCTGSCTGACTGACARSCSGGCSSGCKGYF